MEAYLFVSKQKKKDDSNVYLWKMNLKIYFLNILWQNLYNMLKWFILSIISLTLSKVALF